jgi:hypothetical protein
MVAGWAVFWGYFQRRPGPRVEEPPPVAGAKPQPVVPDNAIEFETVTDRTPSSFRDNAAYAYLLEKAREASPAELARESRRDILLTHVWERPELYRGVPIHILGTARRVLRYESKLSKTGWLTEAWVVTPDARRVPYCCVFEDVPEGFPIGSDVSERVVFNGYFLKIMKYDADIARGSPVLIGRIGWEPHASPTDAEQPGLANGMTNRTFWSLVVLGVLFFLSIGRWSYHLITYLSRPRPDRSRMTRHTDEISPDALNAWLASTGGADEADSDSSVESDGVDDRPPGKD